MTTNYPHQLMKPAGAAGEVLTSNGLGSPPSYQAVPGSSGGDPLQWDSEIFKHGVDFTAGTDNSITLVNAPTSISKLQAYYDGDLQQRDQIASLIGGVLTFTETIEEGVSSIEVYYLSGGSLTAPYLNIVDSKASGVQGGTFTAGDWRTRDLNTERTNEITGASLAANQITLPAGTYHVSWSAPAHDVNDHQTRLQNITDAATLLTGSCGHCDTSSGTQPQTNSVGEGRFTLAAAKTIELQHQCDTTEFTDGFGNASGYDEEIFSQISIWKVA
jgi:hypothetical protein